MLLMVLSQEMLSSPLSFPCDIFIQYRISHFFSQSFVHETAQKRRGHWTPDIYFPNKEIDIQFLPISIKQILSKYLIVFSMRYANEPCALGAQVFLTVLGRRVQQGRGGTRRRDCRPVPRRCFTRAADFQCSRKPRISKPVQTILTGQMKISFIEIKATIIWQHFLL